jgi:hypothetical protein
MIAEHFPPSAQFTNEKLFDQLYVYTHILINESNFYQKFLNEVQVNQYQWILDFFEKNLENYITVVNIDLLVEVLTCFFLSKKTSPIEEKILEHLFTFYDTDEQYLKKDAASTLQDMEHAHSIFLLYLNKPSKLHTV